jgi:hypothetical protein
MSRLGAEAFLQEVFGIFQMRSIPGIEDEVFRGVWNAEDVLFHDAMGRDSGQQLRPYFTQEDTSELLTAFGVTSRRDVREPEQDSDEGRVGRITTRPVFFGGQPSPISMTQAPTPTSELRASRVRVKLDSNIIRVLRNVLPTCTVRGDNTISSSQARTFVRCVFDEDTSTALNDNGIGRVGTLYDVDNPPAGTMEHTRMMGMSTPQNTSRGEIH